jgi:hypothetical protein
MRKLRPARPQQAQVQADACTYQGKEGKEGSEEGLRDWEREGERLRGFRIRVWDTDVYPEVVAQYSGLTPFALFSLSEFAPFAPSLYYRFTEQTGQIQKMKNWANLPKFA